MEKEQPSDVFKDFINSLPDAVFTEGLVNNDSAIPPTANPETRLTTEYTWTLNGALFSLEFSNAKPNVTPVTLSYSGIIHQDELLDPGQTALLGNMFQEAYPAYGIVTPRVELVGDDVAATFDLSNWWHARLFEQAIKNNKLDKAIYRVPVPLPKFNNASAYGDEPVLTFGCDFKEDKEFLHLTMPKARDNMSDAFALSILKRNTTMITSPDEYTARALKYTITSSLANHS